MSDLWSDLLACLNLDAGESETRFTARNQDLEYHRVVGGELLAQFARAAAMVCPDKGVKSLHVLFPREGRADEPVEYDVTRHHVGRSFAKLSITATQSKGPIGVASVSMHTAEDGPQRQTTDPIGPVPGPEHDVPLDLIPWKTRAADDLNATTTGPPEFQLGMRTPAVDPELAIALAAYATDRWLLLRQHSPLVAHGRSFGRGDVLTEDGVLVASYAQESLLRIPN